jgi:hypothetical protein
VTVRGVHIAARIQAFWTVSASCSGVDVMNDSTTCYIYTQSFTFEAHYPATLQA